MTKLQNIFTIEHKLSPQAGRFLVSEPLMNDGIFGRSVVLLTEHNEKGSVGYVLNKPSGFTIQQVYPLFKGYNWPVFIGGPVATNSLHFVYQSDSPIKNSILVRDKLFWGGEIEELFKALKENKIRSESIKFFIGYSGWAPNQLQTELEKNYWIVNEYDNSFIFNETPEMLWKRSVVLLDRKYHFWLNVPINPLLN